MTEKEEKIIRNFINGDKSLYKSFSKIKPSEDTDIYSLFLKAYIADDSENYMKYKQIIRDN